MSETKSPSSRLLELETQNKQLSLEIETLKRENDELKETNNKLIQSLDEAVRSTRPPPVRPPRLKRRLNRAIEQLSETRKQLLDAKDQLTVSQQVTAATQRRELQQEGVYEKLPKESVYEQLRFDSAQEHVYTELQLTLQPASLDALRSQYSNLSTKLDAHTVAVHMYQRNALTLKELQSIQSLRYLLVEAAETLLNVIMEQPDAVYLCFLDVLKHTGQQHIYQSLVEGGYQDYDDGSSHTSVIRAHYVFLLETLDVKFSGLVGQLYSDEVLSAVERDDIRAETTSFRANEKLLSVLSRKSDQQFQLFLDALDKCGQRHVRSVITGQTVGQLVHMFTEAEPVPGVTSLGEEIYLLRKKARDQVEVYDVTTYTLQCCLTVPNALTFCDMTSCERFLCLYIADPSVKCVHRLDLRGNTQQWPVNDEPWGLSVNADHNLVVLCRLVRKIKEFSPLGELLRDVTLCDDVVNPWHAIQLVSGQFIVCHGDRVHRVSKVSSDGQHIIQSSQSGQPGGSIAGQYDVPCHIAVDSDESFVVDLINRRVTLLSPSLNFIRQIVSHDQFKWKPDIMCLDTQRRRLYVAENEWKDDKSTAGRVVVFRV